VVFPLDRLLAILGALLEENDVECRPHDSRFGIPGEYTDMELGRVHIYAAVSISRQTHVNQHLTLKLSDH
jgi:origin recognition complex subunit 5